MLGWRNQPVSMAIAVSRPVATSRVNVPPRALDRPDDQRAGRLGRRVLEEDRPEVVLADVVVDHHPGARELADPARHVAELAPGREVEDHDHLAVGQVGRLDVRAEVLEQGRRRGRGSRSGAGSGSR